MVGSLYFSKEERKMRRQKSDEKFCIDSRTCFGAAYVNGTRVCRCLDETYEKDGQCPFCKDHASVTNGKNYPYKRPGM